MVPQLNVWDAKTRREIGRSNSDTTACFLFFYTRFFFSSFSNRESNPRNQSSKIIKMDLKIHSIVFLCSRFMPNGECGAGAHLGSANCDGESRWNLSWKLLDVNILLSHSRHNSHTEHHWIYLKMKHFPRHLILIPLMLIFIRFQRLSFRLAVSPLKNLFLGLRWYVLLGKPD